MNFKFTDEQEMLRNAFAEFAAREIAPNAARWDADDICPVELMPAMGELGILGIFVPEEYGGGGRGHVERVMALEEIARHSAGVAMMVFTHQLGMTVLNDFGTEEQKKKYLPDMCAGKKIAGLAVTEPGGGSDASGLKTTAESENGAWRINGRKCFISNSHIADRTIVTAKTGVDERGRNMAGAFLIESGAGGFAPGRKEHKMGLKGSVTGDLVMKDVIVPDENLIGDPGQGMPIALGAVGEVGRASMSAICVGLLRACLEESVKFAGARELYGKPISKLQAIQFHIAENRLDYEAARLLLYRAAAMKDEGAPAVAEFSMAKYFGTQAATNAAQRTIELMGAYGVIDDYPAGRFLRDAMASISSGGTSEIQKIIIAGDTLKKFADGNTARGAKPNAGRAGERLTGSPDDIADAVIGILRKNSAVSDVSAGAGASAPGVIPADKAEIVVCGGFGVGGADAWAKLERLAEKIGGAAACTRPVVDEGWVGSDENMVGTSGKTIRPKVYIGIGVSGDPNHTCGMKDSGVIISVNSDAGTNMANCSDYIVTEDGEQFIDSLLKRL
jgi:alkylation response protein AidB-like acyl-CoA dehydrogenase